MTLPVSESLVAYRPGADVVNTKRDVSLSEANRTGPTDTPSTAVGHGGASTKFSNGE
jgi:hypothetical protein